MRNIIVIVALVTAVVSVKSVTASRLGLASQTTPIMPEKLNAYAAKNGWEQVWIKYGPYNPRVARARWAQWRSERIAECYDTAPPGKIRVAICRPDVGLPAPPTVYPGGAPVWCECCERDSCQASQP